MFEDEIKEYESIRNKILVFSEFTMQNISVFSEEMQKIILVFSYFYSKTLVIIRNNAYICTHNPFDEALLKEVNRLATEHTIAYRAQGAIAGEYTTRNIAYSLANQIILHKPLVINSANIQLFPE